MKVWNFVRDRVFPAVLSVAFLAGLTSVFVYILVRQGLPLDTILRVSAGCALLGTAFSAGWYVKEKRSAPAGSQSGGDMSQLHRLLAFVVFLLGMAGIRLAFSWVPNMTEWMLLALLAAMAGAGLGVALLLVLDCAIARNPRATRTPLQ